MRLSNRRTLVQAVIVSLLIHAAFLLGVIALLPVKQDVTVSAINIIMQRDDHRLASPLPAERPSLKPQAAAVRPQASSSRKPPVQPIVAADRKAESFVVPAPASLSTQDVVANTPVSPVEVVGGAVSRPAAPAVSEGISANDLSDLRISLSTAAKRFKNYPRLARERGWEGTVDVVLVFNARSPYPEILLAHSSGRAILDEQALEMVGQAARKTVLPTGLKGRDFKVLLPVKFSLEDDR